LNEIIIAAIANMPGWEHRKHVFGYKSKSSVYGPLRTACKLAGAKYYSPHKLGRHKFSARMLAEGKTIQMIAKAGGWKSTRLVADTYGHLEKRDIRETLLGQTWKKEG